MSNAVIKVENLSKQYRLGKIGTGSFSHDVNRWFHKVRGMEDPYQKVGEVNDRSTKGVSDYVWSLRDVSFEVQQGDAVGIIGRNGAGKSTLLKILSRTTSPTRGSIKIRGRVASLLEVGTGFHPELSGRENIFLNGAILGMTKKEIIRKFDEIVDFAGVERYIDTPVKRYSSGMYVRLAFGVAAHLDPEILIVDEVLAVGDSEFQKKALGKMQDVSKSEGRTVLFVSHNMAAIKNLCNKGVLLINGELKFQGEIDQTVSKYLTSSNYSLDKALSLQLRKDRKGNGILFFTSFSVTDSVGNLVDEVFSGAEIFFRMHYIIKEKFDHSKFNISVVIFDEYEQIVASFPSDEIGFSANLNAGEFSLHIPQVLIRPGRYTVNVYSFIGNTQVENYSDTVENVAELNIISSDYYKTGKPIRRGSYGLMPASYI